MMSIWKLLHKTYDLAKNILLALIEHEHQGNKYHMTTIETDGTPEGLYQAINEGYASLENTVNARRKEIQSSPVQTKMLEDLGVSESMTQRILSSKENQTALDWELFNFLRRLHQ